MPLSHVILWVLGSFKSTFPIQNLFQHWTYCLKNQNPLVKRICKQICGINRYVNFKLTVVRFFLKLGYSFNMIYICICIVHSIYYKVWDGKELLAAQHENLENGKTPVVTRKPIYAFPNISSSLLTPKGTIFLNYVFVISLPFFIVLSPMNCLFLPPPPFFFNLTLLPYCMNSATCFFSQC